MGIFTVCLLYMLLEEDVTSVPPLSGKS